MSNKIVEDKKNEITDYGSYIKVRNRCCLFKQFVVGVETDSNRVGQYYLRAITADGSSIPLFDGFYYQSDAIEVGMHIMDMCCINTSKPI